MNAADLIRRMHEHRAWVNANLLAAAGTLSEDQLRQPMAIGQGSVWKTLLHMYAAEYVWLEALLGDISATLPGDDPRRLPGNQEGPGALESFEQLARGWGELEGRWRVYLAGLTPEALEETVTRRSTSSGAGQIHGTSRADVLMHVCTHAQYTTAQMLNMLRQLEQSSLPEVMLITLARQQAARG